MTDPAGFLCVSKPAELYRVVAVMREFRRCQYGLNP
jgi:hypothetical protein